MGVVGELMVTLFHRLSAAPVILARLLTVTLVLTRYTVPVSVLSTTALPLALILPVVRLTDGAIAVSYTHLTLPTTPYV